MNARRVWIVAALLFGSGCCALIDQVAWFRAFRVIFGTSTAANAAVLAIFVGGLGLGGLVVGPPADRHPRPLLLYAQLEAVVALSVAATPFLLTLVRYLYLASGGTTTLGGVAATIGRVLLSAIVLAIPTIAMGGTLPAAARRATRDTDARRQDVAALYALNTFGAVVGCLVATFWLLETFGTRSTLWMAAAVNLLIALLASLIDRRSAPDARPAPGKPQRGKREASKRGPAAPDAEPSSPGWYPAPVTFVLAASGGVGFAFFLLELVWYRLLTPLLGGTVFTFGLVLAVALAGIGLGGLFYTLVAGDKPATLSEFGSTCLLEAAAVAGTFALGDRIAELTMVLLPLGVAGFTTQISYWMLITALVVLPPALIAGYQFPLLIALFGRGREAVGKQVGRVYAANTAGAILGSLAGGFGLLPWLSAPGAWQLVAVALLVLGAAAVIIDFWSGAGRARRSVLPFQVAIAIAALVFVSASGPTAVWRETGIGAFRVDSKEALASVNQFRDWNNLQHRTVVWEGDGIESSVALTRPAQGYTFILNGKSDGNARGDAGNFIMLGLLGALAAPNARQALVVGLGTGSSAGWLGRVPSIERVDVVELEPLVVEVARACSLINQDVLQNPKVFLTIGDARETLQTTRKRYDIIASQPSNPFRAGIASLFTLEYYRAAADRLTNDGVFVQWLQGYEIDTPALRTVYKTLGTVFPQVETWQSDRYDLVFVASKRPHRYRVSDLTRQIAEEPFKSALAQSWRAVNINGLFAHYLANDSFARVIADVPGTDINMDDRNVIEFGLARTVGRPLFPVSDIRDASRAQDALRPPLEDEGAVRWPEVDTAYVSYNAAQGTASDTRYVGPPNEQARQEALVQYYQHDNPTAARDVWQQQPEPPRDPTELAMLADIGASSGDANEALPYIDGLRPYQPAEADALLSTLRMVEGRLPDAASAVEAAMTRLQTDPWPLPRFEERLFQIANRLAGRDQALSLRMLNALAQPLALYVLEDFRLVTRAQMTRQADFKGLCRDAVDALEPDAPWTQSFLQLRKDCFQAANDPRLPVATHDLNEYGGNLWQPILGQSAIVRPAPAARAIVRQLNAQEISALSGRAQLSYGSVYSARLYNGNKNITVTSVVAEIITKVGDKKTQRTYTAAVTLPPLSTSDVSFDLFVDQGTAYEWNIVGAQGYQ
ncbi:MAG TPA: fused MFS/spermidine synthase [Vicinamibacterales bacterium]|nr:fused MFS/spermidine synthase [Vicinamibacterales bacterium]